MAELTESLVIVSVPFIYDIFKPLIPAALPETKLEEITRQIIDKMDADFLHFGQTILAVPNFSLVGDYTRGMENQIREATHRYSVELYMTMKMYGLFRPSYEGDTSMFPYIFESLDLRLGNLLIKYYGTDVMATQLAHNPQTGQII